MGKMESAIREEISRLAKRESRTGAQCFRREQKPRA